MDWKQHKIRVETRYLLNIIPHVIAVYNRHLFRFSWVKVTTVLVISSLTKFLLSSIPAWTVFKYRHIPPVGRYDRRRLV